MTPRFSPLSVMRRISSAMMSSFTRLFFSEAIASPPNLQTWRNRSRDERSRIPAERREANHKTEGSGTQPRCGRESLIFQAFPRNPAPAPGVAPARIRDSGASVAQPASKSLKSGNFSSAGNTSTPSPGRPGTSARPRPDHGASGLRPALGPRQSGADPASWVRTRTIRRSDNRSRKQADAASRAGADRLLKPLELHSASGHFRGAPRGPARRARESAAGGRPAGSQHSPGSGGRHPARAGRHAGVAGNAGGSPPGVAGRAPQPRLDSARAPPAPTCRAVARRHPPPAPSEQRGPWRSGRGGERPGLESSRALARPRGEDALPRERGTGRRRGPERSASPAPPGSRARGPGEGLRGAGKAHRRPPRGTSRAGR